MTEVEKAFNILFDWKENYSGDDTTGLEQLKTGTSTNDENQDKSSEWNIENYILTSRKNENKLKSTKYNILDLPTEILFKIFSYFEVYELVRHLSPVCHIFNSIANNPILWRHLSFDCAKPKVQFYLVQVIDKCPFLKSLNIESSCINSDVLSTIAKRLLIIESITFKFCEMHDNLRLEMLTIAEKCSELTHVSFEGCNVSTELLSAVKNIKKLKSINLAHCRANDELLNIVVEDCKKLELLNIDGNVHISDSSINKIFALRYKTLKKLWIDGDKSTDEAYSLIGNCKNLTNLNISFCEELTDVSLKEIKKLSKLERLKLRKGILFNPNTLAELFLNNKLQFISHLHLGECSLLNNSTLTAISEGCPALQSFCINWCWEVTDEGLIPIVNQCTRLIVLELIGLVKVTGIFLLDVHKLTKLKILDLEQCSSIDDLILQNIMDKNFSMEKVKIFDYWGDLVPPRVRKILNDLDSDSDHSN